MPKKTARKTSKHTVSEPKKGDKRSARRNKGGEFTKTDFSWQIACGRSSPRIENESNNGQGRTRGD